MVSDLLAIGKKAGLSFVEMNELSVSDLLELARSFAGNDEDKPREATQEDIDAFYGG
jgi:CO dehydrogenase/acetyl-CoA synthase beta subunit